MRKTFPLPAMAALLVMLAGCGGRAGGDEDNVDAGAATVVSVRVGQVASRRFEDVVIATGQWRSSGDVVVSSPIAATVESLEPRVGDTVARGQHIGWLLTRESRAALRGAELLLEQARSARRSRHGPASCRPGRPRWAPR